MKLLSLLIALSLTVSHLLACTGDCLTCHPNLVPTIKTDQRHKPMLTCINCHSANPNSMSECGSDCFACHPMNKINRSGIAEHNVIQGCRDCHMKLKDELRKVPLIPTQSKQEPLREFLINY